MTDVTNFVTIKFLVMDLEKHYQREPVGRVLSKIGKMSQERLQKKLSYLDIDRSFYPLMLIDSCSGLTQQALANELSVDKVQVVRIIDYLSDNGYVERIMNPDDRRKYQLKITKKASDAMPEIKKAIDEVMNDIFQGFTSEQIDTMYKMLNKMEINLLSQKLQIINS